MRAPRMMSPLRAEHAGEAFIAARNELAGQINLSHPQAAARYAGRAIEADDDRGSSQGLVVQGDGVSWRALDALLDLAVYGAAAHARLAHFPRMRSADCDLCRHAEDLSTTALHDPILAQRQAGLRATEYVAAIRARAIGDIEARDRG